MTTVALKPERVAVLDGRFETLLALFDRMRPFTGPSVYFYEQILAERRHYLSIGKLVTNRRFQECAYAGLTAWGMHRMAPSKTKLPPFSDFQMVLRRVGESLGDDLPHSLLAVPRTDWHRMSAVFADALSIPGLTEGNSPLVVNSKLLHFLCPDLFVPIDRTYTLKCLFGSSAVANSIRAVAARVFAAAAAVSQRNRLVVRRWVTTQQYMCGGDAKLFDNAIVGYVKNRFVVPQDPVTLPASLTAANHGGDWPDYGTAFDDEELGGNPFVTLLGEDYSASGVEGPEETNEVGAHDGYDEEEEDEEECYYDSGRDEWVPRSAKWDPDYDAD